ncbi:MAG: transcription antitermination factor NusB [Robiginitomaculum sp.]|nr:MAG: transcription antitermination factor NusB [Robiginitomaculum sp.]
MENPIDSKRRRLARLSAVQALYQMELSSQKSKLVIQQFTEKWREAAQEHGKANTDTEFFELIVLGVVAEQDAIDEAVSGKLGKNWKLSRLDVTMRAIMRCASYELLRLFDVPAVVIIDQYVGLAKDFYGGKEPGFVNAALDKLARERRPGEFGVPGGVPSGVDGVLDG